MPRRPRLQASRSVPGISLVLAVDRGGFRGAQTKGRRGAGEPQRLGRWEGRRGVLSRPRGGGASRSLPRPEPKSRGGGRRRPRRLLLLL